MYIQRPCSFARRIKVSALVLLLFPFTSDCLCGLYQLIRVPNTPWCPSSSHIHSPYHCLRLSSLHTSPWPVHPRLDILLAPTSTPTVQKKRTAAPFVDGAETNGRESLVEADIDSGEVSERLESGTGINYN